MGKIINTIGVIGAILGAASLVILGIRSPFNPPDKPSPPMIVGRVVEEGYDELNKYYFMLQGSVNVPGNNSREGPHRFTYNDKTPFDNRWDQRIDVNDRVALYLPEWNVNEKDGIKRTVKESDIYYISRE